MINESNITNIERDYRSFCSLVGVYAPGKTIEDIELLKTPRGNYKLYDKSGKFIKLVSKNIMNDNIISQYGIALHKGEEC